MGRRDVARVAPRWRAETRALKITKLEPMKFRVRVIPMSGRHSAGAAASNRPRLVSSVEVFHAIAKKSTWGGSGVPTMQFLVVIDSNGSGVLEALRHLPAVRYVGLGKAIETLSGKRARVRGVIAG